MHVLCAPDAFKGCLAARDAAEALAAGARGAGATADACPVADGGEGTLDALLPALGGRIETREVPGPRGEPVRARFGRAGATAIVELAEASGLPLAGARDPETASTRGTGLLIRAAAESGAALIIVGLGGSATIDGGLGLAQAAGATFRDDTGRTLDPPLTGADLPRVAGFAPPPALPPPALPPRIVAACDVDSPLCGPAGAAAVFGPQKGATPEQVRRLDAALADLARRVGGDPGAAGAGAAGGAGFGLATFLGAELRAGAELVLETIGFDVRCAGADLVLTGEGRLDAQSRAGKAVGAVALAAARHAVPCIAVCGEVEGAPPDGVTRAISLAERCGLARAMGETAAALAEVAAEVVWS